MKPHWYPNWTDKLTLVLGSGPSLNPYECGLCIGERFRVIGVNESWRAHPVVDVVYATDRAWWDKSYAMVSALSHKPLLVTAGKCSLKGMPELKRLKVPQDGPARSNLCFTYGTLGTGGNSGFQALNLAIQFGARDIALVGFDMNVNRGKHWHGDHGPGLRNPDEEQIEVWRQKLDNQASKLRAIGIRVINCSLSSSLVNYPKMRLPDLLLKSEFWK